MTERANEAAADDADVDMNLTSGDDVEGDLGEAAPASDHVAPTGGVGSPVNTTEPGSGDATSA